MFDIPRYTGSVKRCVHPHSYLPICPTKKKMNLATTENCTMLCAVLANLHEEQSVIEARRAAIAGVGLDSPDMDAMDAEDMRGLATAIVQLQGLIEALGCDCGNYKDAADGGASSGLSPA